MGSLIYEPTQVLAPERHAEWGHWGITFWCRHDRTNHYLPGEKIASINFPVGTRGPMDSMPGQKERYNRLIRQWIDHGIAPTA